MLRSYKELGFWRNSKEVSLQIVNLLRKFPNERVYWIISDQILRASFSVGIGIILLKNTETIKMLKATLGKLDGKQSLTTH